MGKDPQIDMINWVLGKFREEEQKDLKNAVKNSAKAAYYSIDHSFMDTMNLYNKK